MFMIDGRSFEAHRRAHPGLMESQVRKVATVNRSTPCADCGGEAIPGSPLTLVPELLTGPAAWRRCGDCHELSRQGQTALAVHALQHLDPAARPSLATLQRVLADFALPAYAHEYPTPSELSVPLVDRWDFPSALRWVRRMRRVLTSPLIPEGVR